MKEFNIMRLIESSIYSNNLPYQVTDWIYNFFLDGGFDIDNINVDDLIVNGIRVIGNDEYDEQEHILIHKDGSECYVL